MRLLNEVSPGSMKQFTEDYFTKGKMALNKDTLEGKFERDTSDRRARSWALRSLKESREANAIRTNKEVDQWTQQRRESIIKRAKDAYFEGRQKDLKQLAQKYVQLEGEPDSFLNAIVGTAEAQHISELKRQLFGSLATPQKTRRLVK